MIYNPIVTIIFNDKPDHNFMIAKNHFCDVTGTINHSETQSVPVTLHLRYIQFLHIPAALRKYTLFP